MSLLFRATTRRGFSAINALKSIIHEAAPIPSKLPEAGFAAAWANFRGLSLWIACTTSERGGDIDILWLTPWKCPKVGCVPYESLSFKSLVGRSWTSSTFVFQRKLLSSRLLCSKPFAYENDPKELQILLLTHWIIAEEFEESAAIQDKTHQLLQQSEFSFEELSLSTPWPPSSVVRLIFICRKSFARSGCCCVKTLSPWLTCWIVQKNWWSSCPPKNYCRCDIRNQIAHEYLPEAVPELAKEVVVMTTLLQKNIEQTERFLRQRGWL